MIKRGGGIQDIVCKQVKCSPESLQSGKHLLDFKGPDMLVVEVLVNVCDSMGANLINTICEGISSLLEKMTGGRAALRVLSNLCIHRRAGATFEIPISMLDIGNMKGKEVAKRIMEAYVFAASDPYRTATHNKGVMNGIDSVAIATGQDWRAINSAVYTYSFISGRYKPITHYHIKQCESSGQYHLVGTIDIPLSVGVKGGATQSNSLYQQNLRILGDPTSKELSQIIACVGLAQNFAALKALSLEGIQKGHMKLHAKNIAISAGVPHDLIEHAVQFMSSRKSITTEAAREYLIQSKAGTIQLL